MGRGKLTYFDINVGSFCVGVESAGVNLYARAVATA